MLLLTEKNQVFSFGWVEYGQLGHAQCDEDNWNCSKPCPVSLPLDVKIVQVAAGFAHSIALTHDQQLLTWG